jgi:PTH1 family peptidyl-tRNA hydrolase
MLLLVGLGNPTPDSENNRHNIGFKMIDALNQKFVLSKQKPKFKGLLTTGNIEGKKIYAIKPLTFMNNSGICIRELIEYFKIDART